MTPGEHIGSYRVTRLVGAGGMGSVYEAVNDSIGRRVAIKILTKEQAADKQTLTRFHCEARLANQVQHPGLLTIHEVGRLPDGGAYLIMEFLDGETLASRLQRSPDGRLPVIEVIRFGSQIADALAAVHAVQIVHRDIKPANLMLVNDSAVFGSVRIKVLDFGLAKDLAPEPGQPLPKTKAGIGMGTPSYIAPEQIFGAASVDDRADMYSLGAVLFELLCGRPPFVEVDERRLLGAHVTKTPVDVRELRSDVPSRLAELIAALLDKNSEARPSARQVATLLDALRLTPPGEFPVALLSRPKIQFAPRRFLSLVGVAAVLIGLVVVGLLSLLPSLRGRATLPTPAASSPSPPPAMPSPGLPAGSAPLPTPGGLGPRVPPPPSAPSAGTPVDSYVGATKKESPVSPSLRPLGRSRTAASPAHDSGVRSPGSAPSRTPPPRPPRSETLLRNEDVHPL